MKRFKVTVSLELELPDGFEVVTEQKEEFLCLRQGNKYYFPVVQWLGRTHYFDDSVESAPHVGWQSVDDDTANDFIAWTGSEDYNIESVGDTSGQR